MNATTHAEFRAGFASHGLADERMEEIRELLVGEIKRSSEARLAQLEARMAESEVALGHRIDAMQARVDAMAAEIEGDRRRSFGELARGVQELGDMVRGIARD